MDPIHLIFAALVGLVLLCLLSGVAAVYMAVSDWRRHRETRGLPLFAFLLMASVIFGLLTSAAVLGIWQDMHP